jgi:AraC-like DNA-binding protein
MSTLGFFPVHIHHENEIIYALEGGFEIKVNNRVYRVDKGQVAIINSMVMHEVRSLGGDENFLVIEVGPALLRENFALIKGLDFEIKIYDKKTTPDIIECLDSILKRQKDESPAMTLWTMGYLLQLYSMFYTALCEDNIKAARSDSPKSTRSIEGILKYVYEHYDEEIKIEDIATQSGYCKSGFCKAFKSSTGFTFHNYLNLCRVRNAEHLLVETNRSLDDIAELVGMKEAKVLCREFKKRFGITPRSYRLQMRERSQNIGGVNI